MFTAPYHVDVIGYNGHLIEIVECKHIVEVAWYYHNSICEIHAYDSFNNRIPDNILATLDGRLK